MNKRGRGQEKKGRGGEKIRIKQKGNANTIRSNLKVT